jgi:hypothetical protein
MVKGEACERIKKLVPSGISQRELNELFGMACLDLWGTGSVERQLQKMGYTKEQVAAEIKTRKLKSQNPEGQYTFDDWAIDTLKNKGGYSLREAQGILHSNWNYHIPRKGYEPYKDPHPIHLDGQYYHDALSAREKALKKANKTNHKD